VPELPEVEVIRRGLLPHLLQKKVTRVVSCNRKLRFPVPRKGLTCFVQGSRVTAVDRRAKYLLFAMDSGALMVVHLGMTGRLILMPAGSARSVHDHLRFFLDSGKELRFNDVRRFGSVRLLQPGHDNGARVFAGLGPEPLGRDFSPEYLYRYTRGKSKPLKNLLMDSRAVVGIGNIYANEILFAAGLSPERPAGTLSRQGCQRLVQSCRHVLLRAIECGGTTIADFVNSSGSPGYFQAELQVYGRKDEACLRCGAAIIRQSLAGRATFSCPHCQR